MTRLALAALLLTSGCQEQTTSQPKPKNAAILEESRAAASPPALGSTSQLHGETSSLTGDISDFSVEVTDTGTAVSLAADTLFKFDRADLSEAALINLLKTADVIRRGGPGVVRIVGHTDSKGTADYNHDLSKRRADAVVAWLQTQPGVRQRHFEAEGKGSAEPVAPNALPDGSDSPDGRARNRRVVILIPK